MLAETIESIINEQEFLDTDEIEIVVSDNCSSDNTTDVMCSYLEKYPNKIKYNRNKENIISYNFEKVLSLGSGAILKLNNDTLPLKKGSLGTMLTITKYCVENNLIPFFLNERLPGAENRKILDNKVSFISAISFWCTWVGAFSISKKAFDNLTSFSKAAALNLTQVDVQMQLLNKGHRYLLVNDHLSLSVAPPQKGGYDLTEIFITNYFSLLDEYFITDDEIKASAKEKNRTLYKFLLPFFLDIYKSAQNKDQVFVFSNHNYKERIKKEFSKYTYIAFELKLFFEIKKLDLRKTVKKLIGK
ncbi:glycosyltransferase [Mucilaginibacter sp. R11]|uniref:Glycosyltransferase n=1 Tax=Mucilaginibacter agri TaxID=2695265 RepID=A0A965ZJF0_9SPHI|nr:glycosyltransferase [Mucilaginibacter agri]